MAASPGRDARLRSMAATIRLAFKSKHWGTHAARLLAQLLPPPTSPLPPPLEVCEGLSRDLRCEFKAAFFKRAVRVSVVPLRGVVSLQQCQGSRARAAGTFSRSLSVSAASSFAVRTSAERPELIPYQRWQRLPSL